MQDEMDIATVDVQPVGGSLTDAQKLHFRVSCQYIDKLLSNIEDVLHASESKSPFPKYRVDINLAQVRVLEDYIRRFRSQLLSTLAWQNIAPPKPDIPATRAIGVNLSFIDVTLADMRPTAMRGSGGVSESVASQLSGVVHELGSLTESMMNYIQRELNQSLRERIALLSESDAERLIARVEELVTRHGLVDFRPRLNILLSRLEDRSFEIAVFGRVSSGKSSFLNAILHTEVLPVGVNPITAIPTRISFGGDVEAWVRFGTSQPTSVSLDEFRALVSERTNPGNERAVTRASIKLPSSRLAEGVVLVDTPGLGSLARRGAAETMAYLPSCDLALVLVDAGSTLTEEDIATLRIIREAAIPAVVLLSKCDLLRREDVDATTRYVENQISENLQQDVPVYPVSSIDTQREALEVFFADRLQPQIDRADALKTESNNRKLTRLCEDVRAALQTKLDRLEQRPTTSNPLQIKDIEARLRAVSGTVGELEETLQDRATTLRGKSTHILTQIAEELTVQPEEGDSVGTSEIGHLINEAVAAEVSGIITLAQEVAGNAIEQTRKVGIELGRSDLPDRSELDLLIRDVPQFDSAAESEDLSAGSWTLLGMNVARSRLRSNLKQKYEQQLTQQLETYTYALQQWSRGLGYVLQRSVNAYLDIYRGVLQGSYGGPENGTTIQQLRDDIERLQQDASSAAATSTAQGE